MNFCIIECYKLLSLQMSEEEYDENDLMFKLIRIYVVEYLSTVRKKCDLFRWV
jgi:hypothetical protein